MKKVLLTLSLSSFCFLLSICVFGNENIVVNKEYKLSTIFQTERSEVIWGFDFISKDELVISLRSGKLYYFNILTNEKIQLEVPDIYSSGQGGLLDVHFKTLQGIDYIYFTFSLKVGKVVTTALARGEYKNKRLENLKTIFKANVKSDSSSHFGSRLVFTDNHLFMTIGDRGERKYAQDLSYHNGKILRLTFDGRAAKGNPFESKPDALYEIWSYGHRNPQGIDINPVNQKIYSAEFGPRGGDEVNIINKAKNYGWPIITYGREYWGFKIGSTHKKGMEQPLVYWTPSISPSGMAFYTGDKIKEWKNNLFLAALGGSHLRRLVIKDDRIVSQTVLFKKLGERFRHVRTGLDGYLYVSTDSGKIIKIE
ncbi:MAG: hypothetical protein COA74_08785 [Gammaproteobacteria bacterium]|nr:MAG: hypothetical protein COA74_08785 [Gammaproteobacteria bacterium]